jgi:transposase
MGRERGWVTKQTGRPTMHSPGRPSVNQRDARCAFWRCIATGMSSEDAALACSVSQPLGTRWFREAGGISPTGLEPFSSRYLSFAEREELAVLRAQGHGVREIARQLRRSPSTISRELRRNAATRGGTLQYRATVAQWKAERMASRLLRIAGNRRAHSAHQSL